MKCPRDYRGMPIACKNHIACRLRGKFAIIRPFLPDRRVIPAGPDSDSSFTRQPGLPRLTAKEKNTMELQPIGHLTIKKKRIMSSQFIRQLDGLQILERFEPQSSDECESAILSISCRV